jgi:hypothetical protein
MNNKEQILKELTKKIKAGYPAGELKNELLAKNRSSEEADEIISDLSESSTKSEKIKFNSNNSVLNLVSISMLILGIAIISVRTWLEPIGYILILIGIIILLPKIFKSIGREFQRDVKKI